MKTQIRTNEKNVTMNQAADALQLAALALVTSVLQRMRGIGGQVPPVAKKTVRRARRAAAPKKAIQRKPCIAPDCKNVSKGPRFHFCCEEHRDAPAKTIKAWKKAKSKD